MAVSGPARMEGRSVVTVLAALQAQYGDGARVVPGLRSGRLCFVLPVNFDSRFEHPQKKDNRFEHF